MTITAMASAVIYSKMIKARVVIESVTIMAMAKAVIDSFNDGHGYYNIIDSTPTTASDVEFVLFY